MSLAKASKQREAGNGDSYIVMHVSHTRHRDKGNVMQDPADERIKPGVMDLVNVTLLKFVISPLPSNQIPSNQCYHYTKTCGRSPVYDRVTQQEIFHNLMKNKLLASKAVLEVLTVIVPCTHSESDIEDRPLPELRRQIVLFIGVWDKSVVRCHHCHVEMHKVSEER